MKTLYRISVIATIIGIVLLFSGIGESKSQEESYKKQARQEWGMVLFIVGFSSILLQRSFPA